MVLAFLPLKGKTPLVKIRIPGGGTRRVIVFPYTLSSALEPSFGLRGSFCL